ncbi:MAG: hypothetical protein C0412_04435 [Flavobacterium sp.]|nr:hypothetical protein [Flavobacterium sp.]
MKKILLFFLFCFFLFTACKENNPSSNEEPMTNTAPDAPSLSSPTNNAVNQLTALTLTWNRSSRAETYNLQVSESSSFNSYLCNQSGLTGTSYDITNLGNLTQYYWRVSATNSYGTSVFSAVSSFTTVAWGSVPLAPALISPADRATNLSPVLTLTWNYSWYALSYKLQVSTSSEFTSFVFNQGGLTNLSQLISGLNASTTYYWRVSAANNIGTSTYSLVRSFTIGSIGNASSCAGMPTVTYQGKVYNTIQVGNQCWLKENLDVGNMIISGTASNSSNSIIEKYCYNNDTANCTTYGGFYKWSEAMASSRIPGSKGICPTGFHIPTYFELQGLVTSASGNSNSLKAIGQGFDTGAGTDTTGFRALIGGFYNYDNYFYGMGFDTFFWSSTETGNSDAYTMYLNGNGSNVTFRYYFKDYGLNVRCLKD